MDIIETNKCFCYWYSPPVKGLFNNIEIEVIKGELTPPLILLEEVLKAQVAVYKKAIKDTVKATAAAEDAVKVVAAVTEDTLAEPSELIKLNSDNENIATTTPTLPLRILMILRQLG